ncbi:MAG: FAD-binding oxidoreductase [Verrucomicrobia bacterium]|nr:FAD-binding oxidoreductase [Verrucomicrobiota bacterium]
MPTLAPTDLTQLSELLSCASVKGERIDELNLSALNKIIEHRPEDMTVTVEAGKTVAALQTELRKQGQWLPIDPPNPETLTIGSLLAENLNGPRRLGFGTIRDWLIGIRVALADGTLIRSGGKVVKNVAGYDLMKAFVGSRGTLGVIVEATFKLRPVPEVESFAETTCDSLESADKLIQQVVDSPLCPVVLDLHQLPGSNPILVIGFAGTADEVEWQIGQAKTLGIQTPASLEYDRTFWSNTTPAHSVSVLPSKLVEALQKVDAPFLARAGNGIIYYRGAAPAVVTNPNTALMQRLKTTFDPRQTLPDFPFAK